jgi:hypothetical protein
MLSINEIATIQEHSDDVSQTRITCPRCGKTITRNFRLTATKDGSRYVAYGSYLKCSGILFGLADPNSYITDVTTCLCGYSENRDVL